MTKAQSGRYWREWGRIRKYLMEFGEFSKEEVDAERGEIHFNALKVRKSSKDLTNKDLNKIFPEFQKYLVLIDGPKKPSEVNPEIKSLIYAIEQLGLDDPYLNKIAGDQFQVASWRDLSERQLTAFRWTATRRARAKKKASKE